MDNLTEHQLIPESQAADMIRDWADCLPGDLINLFYNILPSEEGKRIGAFELSRDGIDLLKGTPPDWINRIRIYMGCFNGKFSPIFTLVLEREENEKEYFYHRLDPIPTTNNPYAYPIISSAIADLFQQKWAEISDEELSNAFSGLTCSKIVLSNGDGPDEYKGAFRAQRVRYYDFLSHDAVRIVERIQSSEYAQLKVFLGAGLSVQITHPFDFRPIIKVITPEVDSQLSGDEEEDFERSQPCPPFCHNGIGSY